MLCFEWDLDILEFVVEYTASDVPDSVVFGVLPEQRGRFLQQGGREVFLVDLSLSQLFVFPKCTIIVRLSVSLRPKSYTARSPSILFVVPPHSAVLAWRLVVHRAVAKWISCLEQSWCYLHSWWSWNILNSSRGPQMDHEKHRTGSNWVNRKAGLQKWKEVRRRSD